MTYSETAAFGLLCKIKSGGTFYTINGVHNFGGPNWSVRVIEASHHGSATVIKKPGLRDCGQISFDVYYDSTDTYHQLLLTNHKAKTVSDFQVTITDAGAEVYAFSGVISGMSYRGDVEGFNVYSITVDISGDITVS